MNDVFLPRRESSPGAALSRAREAQNLSIIEVARHLKLTPAQVEALEAGDYDKLPSRVFVRGFLRNYAKLVKIEPGPLLRQLENDMPKPAPVEELRPQREVPLPVAKQSRWPLFAGLFFLFVAALAIYEFGFNEEGHDRANGTRETPSMQPSEKEGSGTTSAPVPPPVAPVAAPAAASPPPSVAPAQPGASAAESDNTPRGNLVDTTPMQSAQTRAAGPGERELVFRFDEDAWVEIRDRDNKIIYSKLNRAGAQERVSGAPPLRLIVGNARKVHLTYDSRQVDLTPHTGVTVARLTIE